MKCQITCKKLLKLINMYEINESGCQVLHEEIQKGRSFGFFFFFFSWIPLPPKVKQNSWVWSWLCHTVLRKGVPSEGGWMSQKWMSSIAGLAGLVLAQFCSCGLEEPVASWRSTTNKKSRLLLQMPDIHIFYL